MLTIETTRLILRNFTPSDWRSLKDLIIWFSASPYAVYDHPWPLTDAKIKSVCKRFSSSDGYLAVCLKDDGRFIGYVSLIQMQPPVVYNLGYCIKGPYQRQGYAFESCGALVGHAFHVLDAEKLISGTASENVASCTLLNKLGFEMTGCAPCSFHTDYDGKPIEFLGCQYELAKHT